MPDPNTATDTAAKPLVPVVPIPAAPHPAIDAAPIASTGAVAGPVTPASDTPADGAPDVVAARAEFVSHQEPAAPAPLLLTGPASRPVRRANAVRDALKARIPGIRAHLTDAANGDHRATVSALTRLTDLVHDMFGPDSPEDSLRAGLTALAAGRDNGARSALDAASTTLRDGETYLEAGKTEAIMASIAEAEGALAAGDRAACQRLIEIALGMIG